MPDISDDVTFEDNLTLQDLARLALPKDVTLSYKEKEEEERSLQTAKKSCRSCRSSPNASVQL